MTPSEEREILVEAAVSAFRERDPEGRLSFSPAWWDLTPLERESVFDAQLRSRMLERLVDEEGLSQTARAVLARSAALRQLGDT